jgi:hypothetical protein
MSADLAARAGQERHLPLGESSTTRRHGEHAQKRALRLYRDVGGGAFQGRVEGMINIRRFVKDAILSIASLGVLIAILAGVNQDVRNQLSHRLTGGRVVMDAASSTRQVATGIVRTARFQTFGYSSLVIFGCVAGGLLLFMMRVDGR